MNDEQPPERPAVVLIGMGDSLGRGGLYNMLWDGGFDRGAALLPLLGFVHYSDVGRFRDIWIERDADGQLWFQLYTRNGGDNSEEYADEIARVRAHEMYERDADDWHDNTYASFWFRVPPDWAEVIEDQVPEMVVDAIDTGQRWKDWADGMESGDRSCQSVRSIDSSGVMKAITSGSAGDPPE